ncbi:TIGR02186 family protein [Thiovibrio sp. JS02]
MKNAMMKNMKLWAAKAAVLLGMIAFSAAAAQALTAEVAPKEIPITLSYHGAKLTITGQSGANDDLVVKISNESHDAAMKYKAKVGGVVWMKKGSLDFKNVPGVYLVTSTADLGRILSDAERSQYQLGYDALAASSSIVAAGGEPADGKWFAEFIRFKEMEMVYSIQQGTITRQHGENGNTFQVEVAWPYQAPPGVYNVEILAVNGGKVVDKAATTFEVQRVGITAALSNMAFNQAALYGIMSVVIAMAAGFAVAAVFKKDGGSH